MTTQEAKRRRGEILDKVRAMLRMTVENGCTEAEAVAAAEAAMRLMDKYHLSASDLDEKEESVFERRKTTVSDDIGARLWRPAKIIADITATRTWAENGIGVNVFFGRDCDVEIATYLLKICEGAMRRAHREHYADLVLLRPNVRSRRSLAFLDGMTSRLVETLKAILAARETKPGGTALVVSRFAEVDAEMRKRKIKLRHTSPGVRYTSEDDYEKGRDAVAGVTFSDGLRDGSRTATPLLASTRTDA